MLTKAKLLALTTAALAPVAYTDKATGEKAFVKRFTVAERADFRKQVNQASDETSDALGYALIACDEKGNLLFTPDDIETINKLPDTVLSDALLAFNTQTAKIAITTDNVEKAEKN